MLVAIAQPRLVEAHTQELTAIYTAHPIVKVIVRRDAWIN